MVVASGSANGQSVAWQDGKPLDLTRGLTASLAVPDSHKPLPEEYIWTRLAAGEKAPSKDNIAPHYFRKDFDLAAVPRQATLYIAGPRSAKIWLNGALLADFTSDLNSPLGMHVFAVSVASALHPGANNLAIEAVRGKGVMSFPNTEAVRQLTAGLVLVAKIVPAPEGVPASDLLHTDGSWKSSTVANAGWNQPDAGIEGWQPVQSLGGIESNIEFLQWNADAGLYAWPGYEGTSSFLAHMPVPVARVLASYRGDGALVGLDSLPKGGELHLTTPTSQWSEDHAPSMLLDFGRELTGRVVVESDSAAPIVVSVQTGESEPETMKSPLLGVIQLQIPPEGSGHTPKSAFRYARIRILSGGNDVRIRSIHVDHIYYPVQYQGSFQSSDPLLNRIWETGAYTAHLCMQDDIWDAPKRDRGRWMGDLDVSGRVIEDVFGDSMLIEDTLDRLLGPADAPMGHVDGIPGYSTFWFTGAANLYRHTGDRDFLRRTHDRMLQLLQVIDSEFDDHNLFANKGRKWLFVDWSAGLSGDSSETRRATTLQALQGYREAVYLLTEEGDQTNARKYQTKADAIEASSRKLLLNSATDTFGPRWQTNATAVLSGAATPEQYDSIWRNVLSQVGHPAPEGMMYPPITPYYGDFVLRAMAQMNRREDALQWIRSYWGGMMKEGATSLWESYDPSWPKKDFHASLEGDDQTGYYLSLAHGWSAGPTSWLSEEVLGVQPTAAGFRHVTIRPDLLDLQWIEGSVPTPTGVIKVAAHQTESGCTYDITLPAQVEAAVSLPHSPAANTSVQLDGKPVKTTLSDGRDLLNLFGPATFHIVD
jgi:hypothetical protein